VQQDTLLYFLLLLVTVDAIIPKELTRSSNDARRSFPKKRRKKGERKKKNSRSANMADGETHIRGNWHPLARDHAQFRPNKTRAALHPVIHTHVRIRDGFFVRAEQARARFCIFQAVAVESGPSSASLHSLSRSLASSLSRV